MFNLPPDRIAQLIDAPVDNVTANWPLIVSQFDANGMLTDNVQIAALATIRVECPLFKPQTEKYNGDPQIYFAKYDGRYGNTAPGDGYKYRGRGFVQLTFKDNYAECSPVVGVDLVADPDAALVPDNAAKIFVHYFQKHAVDAAANIPNWRLVRQRVNGGLNEYSLFLMYVSRLLRAGVQ